MLTDSFLSWWFAPWTYAVDRPQHRMLSKNRLAQRDAYRVWCRQTHVTADLPHSFDPAWHTAAVANGAELVAAARLFFGLIASREHNETMLRQLPFSDRKWCASIAATQPLQGCGVAGHEAKDAIEVRGVLELASRLQTGFPGMWSRLRLTLPLDLMARVDSLLESVPVTTVGTVPSAARAQRCWTLCRNRAVSSVAGGSHGHLAESEMQ